jgi:hypothetical protein
MEDMYKRRNWAWKSQAREGACIILRGISSRSHLSWGGHFCLSGKYMFLCTLERESVRVSWCIFGLGCHRYSDIGTDAIHSGNSAMLLRRRSLPQGADRPAYEFRILQLRPATLDMTQHRKTKRSVAIGNDFRPIKRA